MTDIRLNSLDIISILQGNDGVCVPHIVEADRGQANFLDQPFEVIVDRWRAQMTADLVCEYQIPIVFPCGNKER